MSFSALRFPLNNDLTAYRQALWQSKITHHYQVEEDTQLIILTDPRQYPDAIELLGRVQKGEQASFKKSEFAEVSITQRALAFFRKAPVCATLIVICLAVFLLMQMVPQSVMSWLAITPLSNDSESLATTLSTFQWWRFFTPALLHFGLMHVAFDLLWVGYLGKEIEHRVGHLRFVLLTLASAIISNLFQYSATGPMFGGMSGVVYAFLGYSWLSNHLNHQTLYQVPNSLMAIMTVWLIVGLTPLMSALGFGQFANLAHISGLVFGLLVAVMAHYWHRFRQL